nr:Chain A, Cathelicidin-5 [Bos taurus]
GGLRSLGRKILRAWKKYG